MEMSSLIVALWFVPVTVFLFIPLAICFCWLAIRCVRDLVALKIPFYDYFASRYYLAAEGVQRRSETRIAVNKRYTAVISDGKNTFVGLVANISRMGMCLMEIPAPVPVTEGRLSVIIQHGSEQMTMAADLRWLAEQKAGRTLGLKIADDHPTWNDFVFSH